LETQRRLFKLEIMSNATFIPDRVQPEVSSSVSAASGQFEDDAAEILACLLPPAQWPTGHTLAVCQTFNHQLLPGF
jgi:hypothetical protein